MLSRAGDTALSTGIRSYAAPGRVNLIGEHTDYTGGLVLPMAIPFATTATISAATQGYRFACGSFPSVREISAEDRSGKIGDWTDYPVGVLRELQALGIEPPPFSLEVAGDVPLGAGLSSSASVEVASALAMLAHAGKSLSIAELAQLCRRAENVFVGSPCGIMDQFVIVAATAGNALLLNTGDLSYELLPMNAGDLAGCRVVVANSMVKHSVAAGDYGSRRTQAEEGQAALKAKFGVANLGHATLDQLAQCVEDISAEAHKRCHHIISENARVREAREAMLAGDPVRLGDAMVRSHVSQRDDFECSCAEIDFLVETAITLPGCYGTRLTGGGFGGCTVNLVKAPDVEDFSDQLRSAYRQHFQIKPEIYVCDAVAGAAQRAEESAT